MAGVGKQSRSMYVWMHTCMYVCLHCLLEIGSSLHVSVCQRLKLTVFVLDSNLRTICQEREMAFIWTMNMFTMWMEYMLSQKGFERFHIVDSLWVQLQK